MAKSILKEFLRYAKLSWRQIYLISSPFRKSYREDITTNQQQKIAFFNEHNDWRIALLCVLFDGMFAYMVFWSLTALVDLISPSFSIGIAIYLIFCILVSFYKDLTPKKKEEEAK